MNQQELDIKTEEKKPTTVSDFRFAPIKDRLIKGQPELWWRGKRPFTSTSYFPAQEKEQHGEEVNGWLNKIFWGDNIQVMSHLLKEYRGKVDLIYIDPPFDSKADYKKRVDLKGKKLEGSSSAFEDKQYTDIWTNDEYLQFIYERVVLCRELISDTGAMLLHCDWHKNHLLRMILDEVFGPDNFVNEIIWYYRRWNIEGTSFATNHDNILFYAKKKSLHSFNQLYIAKSAKSSAQGKAWKSVIGEDGIRRSIQTDEPTKGVPMPDVWDPDFCDSDFFEISMINPVGKERIGYPTQKPEKLLERILLGLSNPGDLVFDCFMGSGTTQAVAMKLGRRFIGADINLGAIQTTTKRLINVAAELNQELPDQEHPKYTGFSVYNVNNYDVFRNPVEAKDLLVQALELDPLPGNTVYDGLDEDWYVKIMPVNRIATRQDLNEIEANFPIKEAEKFKLEHPNKVFQKIRLVCMGHEPALDAELKKMIPYNIEVEILDILREKSDLRFKRDAEAKIRRTKKKLIIEKFYPMNLMEKLSMQKEKVKDWREMVESVMIDFNYDGSVFTPTVTDIPEKDEFVKGEYDIPEDAGTIRVKITDLLSESLEQEVS